MKKSAFAALIEIGYTLSDFQEPEENSDISYTILSKENEPDVCILCDKIMLEKLFEESSKYFEFIG